MASSFKIKLKLPPNPNQPGASSSSHNSPQRSSVPAEGSSVADGGSSAVSEDFEGEGEELDELEDSPPPDNETPGASASPSGKAKSKATSSGNKGTSSAGSSTSGVKKQSRPSIPSNLSGKPVDQMTIEEIEALPAAKRRKSLKARGAAGPGRGWRKGLKMDQKPVYVQPGDSPPTKVATGTPTSFASRPKSSLVRDALSKTGTPLRSESPSSRNSPAALDDLLLEGEPKVRSNKVDEEKRHATTATAAATSAAAAIAAATGGSSRNYHRSTQPVLPLAKIPIGFITVTALDKSGSKRPVRPWKRKDRQVVSLTGKSWSALSWITEQQSMVQASNKEAAAQVNGSVTAVDVETPPSTPGETTSHLPVSRTVDVGPSPLSNSSLIPAPNDANASPDVDWRGNSAAFNATSKRAS